jgi:hypothetical protein
MLIEIDLKVLFYLIVVDFSLFGLASSIEKPDNLPEQTTSGHHEKKTGYGPFSDPLRTRFPRSTGGSTR